MKLFQRLLVAPAAIGLLSPLASNASEVDLKETLGHTKLEVFVGSLLGPLVTLLGIFFLGSPLKIFDWIIN